MRLRLRPAGPRRMRGRWRSTESSTSWSSAAAWSARARALDAVTRGLSVGARRGPRLRLAAPRAGRASSSTAACATWRCSTSAWSARRCTERGLLLDRLAPHLVRPVPFLYPLTPPGLGARSTSAPACCCTTRWPARRAPRRAAAPPAPDPAPAPCAMAPCAAQGRAHRRDPVLRRAGRRRPAHDDRGPHRGRRTARTCANRAQVVGLPARGRAGHRRRAGATWRPGDDVRGPRPAGHQRHRRVDRRHPGAGRRARPVPRARVQGHPPRRAAGPDPVRRPGIILRTEKSGAVRHPVGPALDHRHHRHRLVPGQGAPGGQLQPTSTTCSSTSTRCSRHR